MKNMILFTFTILILTHNILLLFNYPGSVALVGETKALQMAKFLPTTATTRLEHFIGWVVKLASLPGENTSIFKGFFTKHLHKYYSISTRLLPSANRVFTRFWWKDRSKVLIRGGVFSVYSGTTNLVNFTTRLNSFLVWLRQFGIYQTTSFFGPAIGAFYSQLVFGKLENFKPALRPLFNVTGIQYILVVSGFHLSLLARTVIGSVHGLLTKTQVAILIGAIVVMYFFLAGASLSLLRASIMLVAAVMARFRLQRQYKASHFFIVMMVLISLVYREILSSVSFQLSATATAGIIYFMPILTRGDNLIAALERGEVESEKLRGNILRKYISLMKGSFLVSVSVNIALIPLLLYYFGEVSLISIAISSFFFWLAPLLVIFAWIFVLIAIFGSFELVPISFLYVVKYFAVFVVNSLEVLLQFVAQFPLRIVVREFSFTFVIGWWLILVVAKLLHSHMSTQHQQYNRLAL